MQGRIEQGAHFSLQDPKVTEPFLEKKHYKVQETQLITLRETNKKINKKEKMSVLLKHPASHHFEADT